MKTIHSCDLKSTNTFEIVIFQKVSNDLVLGKVVTFEKQGYLNNLIRALVTKLPKCRGEGE